MEKYIYSFDEGNTDSNLLGIKGANLVEMTNKHLPVPQGIIITKDVYKVYRENNERLPRDIERQILESLEIIEEKTGKKIDSAENPLLLSIRPSLSVENYNAINSILNIGLNDNIAANLAVDENSAKFIYDTYRKLIMMYIYTVKGKDKTPFELLIKKYKEKRNVKKDLDLTAEDLFQITTESKKIYRKLTGEKFPKDPKHQLLEAIKAIFKSWNNQIDNGECLTSKKLDLAIIVEEMVFGNYNELSFTGTIFSRDNSTGEDKLSGSYSKRSQEIYANLEDSNSIDKLLDTNIKIYGKLNEYSKILEKYYKDLVQIDFIVEDEKLFVLGSKKANKSAIATLNTAVDMAEEGLITKEEAITMIKNEDLNRIAYSTLDRETLINVSPITKGKPYTKEAFSGQICLNIEDAIKTSQKKTDVILIKEKLLPNDIERIKDIKGIITINNSCAKDIITKYCKCYINEVEDTIIDEKNRLVKINGQIYEEGSYLSIDGLTGNIYEGHIAVVKPKIGNKFMTLLSWAKDIKKIDVYSVDATSKTTIDLGIDAIGPFKIENLLFDQNKMFAIRKLIVSINVDQRNKALKELLNMIEKDLEELFKSANGKPLLIKLLDMPLRTLLPETDEDVYELSKNLKIETSSLKERIKTLKKINPITDFRGCSFAIMYPEIVKIEVEAILKAAVNAKRQGHIVMPEILIPSVNNIKELQYLKKLIKNIACLILKGHNIDYKIGTSIETPRNTTFASDIAKEVDFLNIDSYTLTKSTYGFSDSESEHLIDKYYNNDILPIDPFETIDKQGVGKFITVTSKLAHKANPNIKLGVYGKHAESEENIKFFKNVGINYISSHQSQIPIVMLAAARAEINGNKWSNIPR